MRNKFMTAMLLSSLISAGTAARAECSIVSGPTRTALLELYTSEGCSSCPPADRWLSRLRAQGYDAGQIVPLALHVDYWDYIGWQDRFADPAFTARQRTLAAVHRFSLVYTPQAILNGRDYRGWHNSPQFAKDLASLNRQLAQASIRLSSHIDADGKLEISALSQAPDHANATLYIAVFENNLSTAVKAGENRGATLHHDYVVRAWLGPFPIDQGIMQTVPLKPGWKRHDLGVAAFVQKRTNAEVLQAVALNDCSL